MREVFKDSPQIVYKRVRKVGRKYFSLNEYDDCRLNIQYKVGKFIFPKVRFSHLFAFNDLEYAKWFGQYTNTVLFKAEALVYPSPLLLVESPFSFVDGVLKPTIKKYRDSQSVDSLDNTLIQYHHDDTYVKNFYAATAGCKKIKLLERIE